MGAQDTPGRRELVQGLITGLEVVSKLDTRGVLVSTVRTLFADFDPHVGLPMADFRPLDAQTGPERGKSPAPFRDIAEGIP